MADDGSKALGAPVLAGAFVSPKVGDEIVARVPRAEVTGAELDPGTMASDLTIAFADGGSWELEVGKIHRGSAEQVVQALVSRSG